MEKNPFSLKIKITHLNRKMNTDPIIRPTQRMDFCKIKFHRGVEFNFASEPHKIFLKFTKKVLAILKKLLYNNFRR